MNYKRLKDLAKEKKITIKRLVEENTDMKEGGFHAAIKNNSLTIRVLEDIARALDVPVGYFFDDGDSKNLTSDDAGEVDTLRKQVIELQRQLIAEKERVINLLKNEQRK